MTNFLPAGASGSLVRYPAETSSSMVFGTWRFSALYLRSTCVNSPSAAARSASDCAFEFGAAAALPASGGADAADFSSTLRSGGVVSAGFLQPQATTTHVT